MFCFSFQKRRNWCTRWEKRNFRVVNAYEMVV